MEGKKNHRGTEATKRYWFNVLENARTEIFFGCFVVLSSNCYAVELAEKTAKSTWLRPFGRAGCFVVQQVEKTPQTTTAAPALRDDILIRPCESRRCVTFADFPAVKIVSYV